jgi:hypothetical protein
MEHRSPPEYHQSLPSQEPPPPPQQQPQPIARGRGRRAYAAQQYEFNAPLTTSVYGQQQPYPTPGYATGQTGPSTSSTQQEPPPPDGQPPANPLPGHQVGHEYQPTHPNVYPSPYSGGNGVTGATNQFQKMTFSEQASSNRLHSIDLMSTAPNITGLYAPPPPLLLPGGVTPSLIFH